MCAGWWWRPKACRWAWWPTPTCSRWCRSGVGNARSDAIPTVYIGLGSNLREPVNQIITAIGEFERMPATRVSGRSSLYRTRAIGPGRQPDYVNAVIRIQTALPPLPLLARMLRIEQSHQRTRSRRRWRARTLDLDMLLYGRRRIRHPRLKVPHPLLHTRAFVLVPLDEIAPDLMIPGHGRVGSRLPRLKTDDVARLPD